MEIANLPISASQRSKLLSAGFATLSSLSSLSPSHLARDLNIELQEALEILKVVSDAADRCKSTDGHHQALKGAQTAWDMLSEEQMQQHITTGCEDLDNILRGGIHCGEVTEVGGVPGIGKTQLGIQLAVNVQIPVEYGGHGGKAVYIGIWPNDIIVSWLLEDLLCSKKLVIRCLAAKRKEIPSFSSDRELLS